MLNDDIIIYISNGLSIKNLINVLLVDKYLNSIKYHLKEKINKSKYFFENYNLDGTETYISNLTYFFKDKKYHNLQILITDLIQVLPNIDSVYLSHSDVNDIEPICNGVKNNNSIKKINFGWNKISDIKPLIKLFSNNYLHKLYLSGNLISDIDFFSEKLQFSYIKDLSLAFNRIRNIDKLFYLLPTSNIEILDISGNYIKNINFVIFKESLFNCKLNRLSIWNNPLNDEDYKHIGKIWESSSRNIDNLYLIFR